MITAMGVQTSWTTDWAAAGAGRETFMSDHEVMSRCPVCQERVYVGAGEPTPPHNAEGSDKQCPGTGQPSR